MTGMEIPSALAAEVEPWLQECGSCDAGLPMSCTCPPGDYRNILLKVWRAYEATAAEVKVLTETASKVAYALGRKDALEEAVAMLDAATDANLKRARDWQPTDSSWKSQDGAIGLATGYQRAAERVRGIASQPSGATSDATSGVGGHPEVSEAVRNPQEPGEGS